MTPVPRYPPAPWRLKGGAVAHWQLLPTQRVRHLVPPGLSLVSVAPGRTLGGLYLASYGAGSTLRYHELIVIAALVRQGGRLGGWISHIYVDDPQSQAGGRNIWGLPKVHAQFDQTSDGGWPTQVRQGSSTLCRVAARGARGAHVRLPVYMPVLTQRCNRTLWFCGHGWAGWRIERSEVDVPYGSPFADLGFDRGWRVALTDLDVRIQAP